MTEQSGKNDLSDVGRILLVGCGKMGGALLHGWLQRGVRPVDVTVIEPALDPSRVQIPQGVSALKDASALPDDLSPDVVILAVKPQAMRDVVPAYRNLARSGTVFLSIAAGTPIRFFEEQFGDAAVVRVMPNTPAAVGKGMSVLCANHRTDASQRASCEALMAAVGATAWLEDEDLMDAVTAVSGSGPAYVFLLIECLARAGTEAGLPEAMAKQLAMETVAGAGALAQQSGEEAAQLRINVTSPGGTTQAALEVLMADDGLQPLLTKAVAAATRRGKELGA